MIERIYVCDGCGEGFDDENALYHVPGKKLCLKCFLKELEKAREKFIEIHPCPFKTIEQLLEGTRNLCNLTNRSLCVGEKFCPIYNGGLK